MHFEQIFILLFVCPNVLPMLTKNKCIFDNLCELGNKKFDNDASAENGKSEKELATKAPEQQQMSREIAGGPNEYILQWFYNYEAQPPASASIIASPPAEPPAWVRFIKIHIKEERADILEIEAFVSEDEGATVEICLCDKKNGFCYGPFEGMEQIDSTTLPQCVHFNYQSILTANNAQKKDGNLLVKAKFKLNFNLYASVHKNNEGKKQQDNVIKGAKSKLFGCTSKNANELSANDSQNLNDSAECQINIRNRHIVNLLKNFRNNRFKSLDEEFFLRISYESKLRQKMTCVWAVQKCVKFVLLQSLPADSKL